MGRLDKNSTYKAYLRKQAQEDLKGLGSQSYDQSTPLIQPTIPQASEAQQPLKEYQQKGYGQQNSILGAQGSITQGFGQVNPGVEVFSRGGVNTGTDIGVPVGTPVALPQGKWKVLESFADDSKTGHIGDNTNRGYGNSVLAQNLDTGEKLRFSHLSKVGVNPEDEIDGGNILGYSGDTGNVTGPHLDLEYYNKDGKVDDILKSLYAMYLNLNK